MFIFIYNVIIIINILLLKKYNNINTIYLKTERNINLLFHNKLRAKIRIGILNNNNKNCGIERIKHYYEIIFIK